MGPDVASEGVLDARVVAGDRDPDGSDVSTSVSPKGRDSPSLTYPSLPRR
jgi:hypothetical protein